MIYVEPSTPNIAGYTPPLDESMEQTEGNEVLPAPPFQEPESWRQKSVLTFGMIQFHDDDLLNTEIFPCRWRRYTRICEPAHDGGPHDTNWANWAIPRLPRSTARFIRQASCHAESPQVCTNKQQGSIMRARSFLSICRATILVSTLLLLLNPADMLRHYDWNQHWRVCLLALLD